MIAAFEEPEVGWKAWFEDLQIRWFTFDVDDPRTYLDDTNTFCQEVGNAWLASWMDMCCALLKHLKATTQREERGILFHCFGGVNRSSAALCAWLIFRRQLSAEAAVQSLLTARPTLHPWKHRYVEAGSYPVYLEYFTVKSGYSRLKFYYRGPDTGDEWALVCSGGASTCSPLDPPHKPEITVFGDNPSYFLKNASADYEDPGSQCLSGDEDSVNRWAWEVVLEKPSLGTTGTFYTNYTCEDSYGLIDTANREVIIRDVPSITLIGPTPFVLLKDDTFSDPQACCLDFAGNSLSVVSFQSVTSDEGVYETSYTCVDPLISYMVTANRQVVVNTEPVIELLGDSTVKITKGTGYVDDGIVCHDAEDGLITNIRPDNEEIIRPARVYTSDSSTATARAAVDGNGEDTCGNCELVQTGLLRWVQLDLGAPRSVTQVRLYAPSDGPTAEKGRGTKALRVIAVACGKALST
ncbi:Sodium/potassium/calcium exchanger 1 [Durusdinium trenchii]|uniref:Sodium/potassium/calcium exchanger 1 n=1 Tax=Durusdinium trenchii TaxID=1381693 RepID=A0ABP0HRD3_9DINO